MIDRRNMLKFVGAGVAMMGTGSSSALGASESSPIAWWSTTADSAWQVPSRQARLTPAPTDLFEYDVMLAPPAQAMTGIGGAFSELGWQALCSLGTEDRAEVLRLLFGASGAAFNLCRTPMGANDLARSWYSYDETADDFALDHFSIDHDRQMLLPFIKAAQLVRPELKLWASPWSPPTWMKTNRHYALTPAWPSVPSNGIRPDQIRQEGTDAFIQEDRYFDCYARYFRRYIEAYAALGVPIGAVMPQNEFNSPQSFPSCCWSPEGLARFLPFLGREMDKVGVDILFGTLERANPELVTKVLQTAAARKHVKGIGIQWAGKGAIAELHRRYPDLALWGTEQECGVGVNDWHFARHGWELIKQYIRGGSSVWQYWQMVCAAPGTSTWGWRQNALVSIDPVSRSFRLTPDYWVMRHLSARLVPGARFIPTNSIAGFEDQLVFRNPDGGHVVVIANQMAVDQQVRLIFGSKQLALNLPAASFNTIEIPSGLLPAT